MPYPKKWQFGDIRFLNMKIAIAFVLALLLNGCGSSRDTTISTKQEKTTVPKTETIAKVPTDAGSSVRHQKTFTRHGLTWIDNSYESALAEAQRTAKPIFVNFSGDYCTNSVWMERTIFVHHKVSAMLQHFVLVELSLNHVVSHPLSQHNFEMMQDRYKTLSSPFYALVSPHDSVLATQGFTRDYDRFITFLESGLNEQQ